MVQEATPSAREARIRIKYAQKTDLQTIF